MILELLRYVVVLQAAWVMGVSIAVLPSYFRDRYFAHIALVAVSYIGFVVLAVMRCFRGEPLPESIYIPVVAGLLLFGDAALLILLKRKSERRKLEKTIFVDR